MSKRKVFESRRPDGRFETTASFVHHRLKSLAPRLAFDPSLDADALAAWRKEVRRKLRELMAFPKTPPQPAPVMIDESPRDGYSLQRWEIYPEPDSVVPFLMLVPDGVDAAAPGPAVMCIPGSQCPKEALAGEPWRGPWKNPFGERQFMAKHFAQAGMVAVAFDNPGTADLVDPVQDEWTRQSWPLIWLGRTYEGLSVFQKWIALRWLKTLPFVDRRRVATCGHSLGAKPALILGVLDGDVRAVVWNDHAANWREREVVMNLVSAAPWHYVPGFATWFDYMDLMAALAPRPLLITEGGRAPDHSRIRKAYEIAGAKGAFKVTWMPNFRRASQRPFDRKTMPEGLTTEEYARYANYDTDHYFKHDVAVPWMRKLLKD